MKAEKIITTLLLVFFVNEISFSQNLSQPDPWFFIQVTDPQFGMFDNNEGFKKETILYEKAVSEINKLNPDFVVITGDFVHDTNSGSQMDEFKRITAKIKPQIPVYLTPGNHDLGSPPDKESIKNYRKNYGSDKFSFTHKGSAFIGFNTSIIKDKLNRLEQKQYQWLDRKLKESQEASHIVLFCHFPFFIQSVDEPESYSNLGIESRKKYLTLFEAQKVDAVFSGHYHNNALASYGHVQLVTTSALGKPLGEALSGFRIVKIYPDRIEHRYYGLDELPDSVKFD